MSTTLTQKLKTSVTIKIIFILFMILLLMIPMAMVSDVIRERSGRKSEIEREIAKSFGGKQTIMPPIIKVPYSYEHEKSNGHKKLKEGYFFVSPNTSTISGSIDTDIRTRSIYDVVVYDSQISISENFKVSAKDFTKWKDYKINYEHASLIIGLQDKRGLAESSSVMVNNQNLEIVGNSDIGDRRLSWVETAPFTLKLEQEFSVLTKLQFKGTGSVKFEPVGEEVKISLNSKWPDPSFVGSALPERHDVTTEGFTADWSVNKYGHNRPAVWTGESPCVSDYSFGVNLIQPIDEYGKNTRTSKYAMLILALTFGIFFFFEILFKKNIHPIQYTLVGFALVVFYLLLLSITEHLGFDIAYGTSAIATIGLISIYTRFIVNNSGSGMMIAGLLMVLFGYVYIILQMQDFALLAGALALFAVLSTVMILSRNVDWYNLSKT